MYFSASELLEVRGRGAALRALVGGVADHGVAADGAHANRLDAEVLLALHALELGDGVVGGVHLVDLEGLATPGRLEVVGGRADTAEHTEVVAGVRALGVGHAAEEARDVGVALSV